MRMDQKLNYIRGGAALCVVLYHYGFFFFTNQTFCAQLCFFPPIEFAHPFIETIESFPFDLGQFAVTLFFLLSGFLSPYLIEKYKTRAAFLRNRFFRLWPIYAVGLLINILSVVAGSFYTGGEWPYSFDHVLASLFCVRDLLGYSYITGIVWTFEIEVKFIIFCLFVFSLIKNVKIYKLFLVQACFFFVVCSLYLTVKEDPDTSYVMFSIFKALTNNAKYFCLILIGMYFSFIKSKKISTYHFAFISFLSILIFNYEESFVVSPTLHLSHFISYSAAIIVFGLTLLKDKKETATHVSDAILPRSLNYISQMSYPLYLIHAIPGYILMYILYDFGFPLYVGILLAFLISLWAANLLHTYIEAPLHALGRRK